MDHMGIIRKFKEEQESKTPAQKAREDALYAVDRRTNTPFSREERESMGLLIPVKGFNNPGGR